MAQVLRQAQDDVAVEAWADKNAEPRDLASLVAEVSNLTCCRPSFHLILAC